MRARSLLYALVAAEAVAGIRALRRIARTLGGTPLAATSERANTQPTTVIVPVLNEEDRLAECLTHLSDCDSAIEQILVVDGGSHDRTAEVVAEASARDSRIVHLDASLTPLDWNGKAWNLQTGLHRATTRWIVTVDADVRIGPKLIDTAIARAEREDLAVLSIATRQQLPDNGAGLLHPAFLTTLVYRTGTPNVISRNPKNVQANGQVMLARRSTLIDSDAFAAARTSLCEDVTVARTLARHAGGVGFYEGDATVMMHHSWRDCAANWPRSLTLRDHFVTPADLWSSLIEALLAQALPLPTLLLLAASRDRGLLTRIAIAITIALVAARIGVLAGTRRAYIRPPLTYWLSPLADLPAVALLFRSALRRTHVWRGRTMLSEKGA